MFEITISTNDPSFISDLNTAKLEGITATKTIVIQDNNYGSREPSKIIEVLSPDILYPVIITFASNLSASVLGCWIYDKFKSHEELQAGEYKILIVNKNIVITSKENTTEDFIIDIINKSKYVIEKDVNAD